MNAIAAVFGVADPHAARAVVKTLLDRMPLRGAGHRIVVGQAAAVLGAAGRAPTFSNKPDHAMLAGDLQIANRADLRKALDVAADAADGAIALEGYCRWGLEVGRHMAGPFALLILDRLESRLVGLTDPLGLRPLYYRQGTSRVRVASELQALVEEGDRPDEGFLAEVLSGAVVDRQGTPYASIRRVPGGHAVLIDGTGITVKRYWEPPREPLPGSAEEHARRFHAVLEQAVSACCDGQAAVGVHLDGSTQASLILTALTTGDVATPVTVSVPSGHVGHDLDSIPRRLDLPDLPNGVPLMRLMFDGLKERGIAVLLSPLGGEVYAATDGAAGETWLHRVRHLPGKVGELYKRVRPGDMPEWIDPAFAKRVHLADRLRPRSGKRAPSASWRRLRQQLEGTEAMHARDRADRLSVETGIEMRHPFSDLRVVELAFGMAAAGTAASAAEETAASTDSSNDRVLVDALQSPGVEALLGFPRLTELGWIRPEPLAGLHREASAGSKTAAASLWNVLAVEAWLQHIFKTPHADRT